MQRSLSPNKSSNHPEPGTMNGACCSFMASCRWLCLKKIKVLLVSLGQTISGFKALPFKYEFLKVNSAPGRLTPNVEQACFAQRSPVPTVKCAEQLQCRWWSTSIKTHREFHVVFSLVNMVFILAHTTLTEVYLSNCC